LVVAGAGWPDHAGTIGRDRDGCTDPIGCVPGHRRVQQGSSTGPARQTCQRRGDLPSKGDRTSLDELPSRDLRPQVGLSTGWGRAAGSPPSGVPCCAGAPARSMVWPTSPGAMACAGVCRVPLDAPAGRTPQRPGWGQLRLSAGDSGGW
jgi:hypothetical protein